MTVRLALAMVVGVVASMAAPWPWLAATIAIALPMALGIWLVAHLTTSRLVVRNVTHQPTSPGGRGHAAEDVSTTPRIRCPVRSTR